MKSIVLLASMLALTNIHISYAGSENSSPSSVSITNYNQSSMPLPFTKNMGQWPDSILFRASANGATMWFTKNGIWYQFFRRVEKTDPSATAIGPTALPFGALPNKFDQKSDSIETTMIKAEFVGASESVEVVGLEELKYKCNYFIGNEPDKWRTDAPNYSAVTMRGLYLGVDVTFSSKDGRLQEELVASTSSNLAQVKVEYRGADGVTAQTDYASIVQTSLGEHKFEGVLLSDSHESDLSKARSSAMASSSTSALSLVYSTYLGGSGYDYGGGIAVDPVGNAYITGYTSSADFPTQNSLQSTLDGADAFVTKLNSAGSGLIYSTYLGGSFAEEGYGIAVDTGGNAYVLGMTNSTNFPTQNPFQTANGGGGDAFVTKLNSAGSGLIYSTYLGGSDWEFSHGFAVDEGGNAYVTGTTYSADFPTQNPFQATYGGNWDAFVTKLNSAGTGLIYSTYLGGSSGDGVYGMAVDAGGNAYVTGQTESTNFPTQNPFQAFIDSGDAYDDAFVTKLNSAGTGLIYSTYLGGSSGDGGYGIAVDAGGNAYVTGQTASTNFPTQNPFQPFIDSGDGYPDAFVTKLNSAGSGLIYSTYLGGSGYESAYGIAVDAEGYVYARGETESANFPTQNPFQASLDGSDGFLTKLNSAGTGLIYSTYLWGAFGHFGRIAVDTGGNAYVTGGTNSANFPTTPNAFQIYGGLGDAFVTKFGALALCCVKEGDANHNSSVNVVDITYLVTYLFKGGPIYNCKEEADVNDSGSANVVDVTYLVNYLFKGGPITVCP